MKHTIELEEDLLILMIDATLKKLKNDIKIDSGKNKHHTENLKIRHQEMLDLLESITP